VVRLVAALIALTGCGRLGFDQVDRSQIDAPGRGDAEPPRVLGPFGPWSAPVRMAALNSNSQEFGPTCPPTRSPL